MKTCLFSRTRGFLRDSHQLGIDSHPSAVNGSVAPGASARWDPLQQEQGVKFGHTAEGSAPCTWAARKTPDKKSQQTGLRTDGGGDSGPDTSKELLTPAQQPKSLRCPTRFTRSGPEAPWISFPHWPPGTPALWPQLCFLKPPGGSQAGLRTGCSFCLGRCSPRSKRGSDPTSALPHARFPRWPRLHLVKLQAST